MLTLPTAPETRTCPHVPPCPPATAADHDAAHVIADHHADMGAVLLCNGVWLFDDTGELLPSGAVIAPHRAEPAHRGAGWGVAS